MCCYSYKGLNAQFCYARSFKVSSAWVWEQYLVPEINKIVSGGWEPNPWGAFLSIKDGGTDAVGFGSAVSDDLKAKVMAERAAIIAGKHIFAGPILDSDGKERVVAGAVLGDGDIWAMDWFVSGVTSQ